MTLSDPSNGYQKSARGVAHPTHGAVHSSHPTQLLFSSIHRTRRPSVHSPGSTDRTPPPSVRGRPAVCQWTDLGVHPSKRTPKRRKTNTSRRGPRKNLVFKRKTDCGEALVLSCDSCAIQKGTCTCMYLHAPSCTKSCTNIRWVFTRKLQHVPTMSSNPCSWPGP